MRRGIIATVAYIAAVIAFPFLIDEAPTEINEWGDYFAGFLAPAALCWFIATLRLQGNELSLQREELALQRHEMELSREVMRDQSAHLLEAAKANLEANRIAAASAFADELPMYHKFFEETLGQIAKKFLDGITFLDGIHMIPHPRNDPEKFLFYLAYVEERSYDLKTLPWNLHAVAEYQHLMAEFHKKAVGTGNTIYFSGSWIRVGERLDKIFGTVLTSEKTL
jgi:hypothetical protein